MAPSLFVARAKSQDSGNGLSITSAAVKKGHPTVVKYFWEYHDKSPNYFTIAVINVSSKEFIFLDNDIETRGHGKNGKGTDTVSIESLKNYPGKYVLVLVDTDNYNIDFATSKALQVNKSDF